MKRNLFAVDPSEIPEKSKPLERVGRKATGSKTEKSVMTARLPVFQFAF